jgi:hypothetical protein
MVTFKTKFDGIVHLSATLEQHEVLFMRDPPDSSACGLFLVTTEWQGSVTLKMALGWQDAIASDERATCVLCLGS